ncbi:hypothetical protein JXA32_12250 [Candidatus Sumerlaeota bacterium]|nr:hypothetical protein [Candidatus Sumerlaeota bacterium]
MVAHVASRDENINEYIPNYKKGEKYILCIKETEFEGIYRRTAYSVFEERYTPELYEKVKKALGIETE